MLVHGGGLDAAALSWREVLPRLAEEFAVYAPDLPGYGGSARPRTTPSARYYAGIVTGFLRELDLTDVRLAGVSLGGAAVIGATLESPDRVSRLAPIDAYGLGSTIPGGPLASLLARLPGVAELSWAAMRHSPRLVALSVRVVVAPGNATPALVDDVVAAIRETDGDAWRRFQRAEVTGRGLATNYLDDLPQLAVPTLYVHGEADPLVPSGWAVRAASVTPDATLRVLGNCGHWAPRERPERVADLLAEFFADGGGSGTSD